MNNNGLLVGLGVLILIGIGAAALLLYHPVANTPPTSTSGSTSGSSQNAPTPGAPTVTTSSSASVSNSTAIVSGNVTPNGAQTSYWYEYGLAETLGSRTSAQNVGSGYVSVGAPDFITGLAPSTKYYFRLVAQNSLGTVNGVVYSFTTNTSPPPSGSAPVIHTGGATAITRTSVNLNGTANPDGSTAMLWFEYGPTADLGFVTSFESATAGSGTISVSAAVSGLDPSTKYYFRLDGQNQYGTVIGSMNTFTTAGPPAPTAPSVDTTSASAVERTTAELNGTVNPNGADTVYWFEYSQDSLLGSIIGSGTAQQSIGSGTTEVSASADISGLLPGTRYYYRIVASNSQGTVRGDIVKFTTKR